MRLRDLADSFVKGKKSGKGYMSEIKGDILYSWGHPIARHYGEHILLSTMYNGGSVSSRTRCDRHIHRLMGGKNIQYVQGWADEDAHNRIIKHQYRPHYTTEWGFIRNFVKSEYSYYSNWLGYFWDGKKQDIVMDSVPFGKRHPRWSWERAHSELILRGECIAIRAIVSPCFYTEVIKETKDCYICPDRYKCYTEKEFGFNTVYFVLKDNPKAELMERHFKLQDKQFIYVSKKEASKIKKVLVTYEVKKSD